MVQAGRADIALVTRSYLSDFLARNPASREQLMPSQRIDQVYSLTTPCYARGHPSVNNRSRRLPACPARQW